MENAAAMTFRVMTLAGGGKRWPWELSAAGLALALAADYFVFRLFDADYFRWYLATGPVIQLLVTAFALAIDLERWPNLISAHPSDYLGACERLIGLSFIQRADELRPHDPGEDEPTTRSNLPSQWPLDGLITVLFDIAFVILSVAWLVVIAPIQYFGNLVAGAPARLALAKPSRFAIVVTAPDGGARDHWMEIGLVQKPVAVTASITAGLLLAISYVV